MGGVRWFRSITEIWLEGDHYEWRAMRTAGVPQRHCTGDASDWEKFEAWARTVPETHCNPLFHWTATELKRPFGVTELLSPDNARRIFDHCNARLQEAGFTTLGLLAGFRVVRSSCRVPREWLAEAVLVTRSNVERRRSCCCFSWNRDVRAGRLSVSQPRHPVAAPTVDTLATTMVNSS